MRNGYHVIDVDTHVTPSMEVLMRYADEELKRRADELQKIAQKLADDASVKGRELIDEAKKQWDSSSAGRASTGSRGTPGGSTKQD